MKITPENTIYNSRLARYPVISAIIVAIIFLACMMWAALLDGIAACMLIFISLALVGLFGMPFVLGLPSGRKSLSEYSRDIWLRTDTPLGQDILIGLIIAGLLLASLGLSSLVTGNLFFNAERLNGFQVFEGLTHGIWEEVYFRGVILVLYLRVANNKWIAMALVSGIFAVVHFDIYDVLRLMLIGFLWSYMTLKSGSLLPAIISHTIFDIFSVALVPDISGEVIFQWLLAWHVMIGFSVLLGMLATRRIVQKWSTRNLPEPSVL